MSLSKISITFASQQIFQISNAHESQLLGSGVTSSSLVQVQLVTGQRVPLAMKLSWMEENQNLRNHIEELAIMNPKNTYYKRKNIKEELLNINIKNERLQVILRQMLKEEIKTAHDKLSELTPKEKHNDIETEIFNKTKYENEKLQKMLLQFQIKLLNASLSEDQKLLKKRTLDLKELIVCEYLETLKSGVKNDFRQELLRRFLKRALNIEVEWPLQYIKSLTPKEIETLAATFEEIEKEDEKTTEGMEVEELINTEEQEQKN